MRALRSLSTSALLCLIAAAGEGADGIARSADPQPSGINSDEVLLQTFRAELEGGVVVAGCGLRTGGPPEAFGNISIAGIPAGASVVKAILNWSIMSGSAPSSDATFHLATAPAQTVTGTLLGQDGDPCWSLGFEFVYTADVTAIVTGDGDYRVGVPDSGDLTLPPSAEGATLIVVWCLPGAPRTDVVIYEGFETQISGDTIQTVTGFDAAGTIGSALATFVVADGQSAGGMAMVNGAPVITPVFDGDEGRCASATGQFYDVDTVDVSALVAPGNTSLTASVVSLGDCLNWNAFVLAISTDTVTSPSPCAACPSPPAASPGSPVSLCAGDSTTLDGNASTACSAAGLEYQWRDGTSVVCPWSPASTCLVTPTATTSYTLEVRCLDDPSCSDDATVAVNVAELPSAVLLPPPAVCAAGDVTLDASASSAPTCSGQLEYQFSDGSGILQPWSPVATYGPFAPGVAGTYTVEVRCDAAPGCVSLASQPVDVLPYPVPALLPLGTLCAGASVLLDASGTLASGCPVPLEFQFRDALGVLQAWSTAASHGPFTASSGGTYTVEARCSATPGCVASESQDLVVLDPPLADLVALGTVCAGTSITLDARGSSGPSCPVALVYQFRDSGGVIAPWSASATFGPLPASASGSYFVDVRCPAAAGCEASASRLLEVVPRPQAVLAPLAAVCAGSSVMLDVSASSGAGCPVALEYQFSSGATVLAPWGASPSFGPVAPVATTAYTVEVRCPAAPGCEANDTETLTVVAAPTASAGADVQACVNDPVTLSGAGSNGSGCPGGALYEWRESATVRRPPSPVPTWAPPTSVAATTVYTLVVSCAALPACAGSDDVTVRVRDCPMAVHFIAFGALLDAAGTRASLHWRTGMESGTLAFEVERSSSAAGPWQSAGTPVEAVGPGFDYRFEDPLPAAAWYRIVELTDLGRGDVSAAFAPTPADAGAASGSRRGRVSRRAR